MNAERGSAKHGPRVDEEQKHEVEGAVRGGGPAHAEEWLNPEPFGDVDEDPARRYPPGHEPGTAEGITPGNVERRSTLAKWLSDARWPADRDELLAHAEEKMAPDSLVASLRDLPDGEFHNIGEVARALGLGSERHRW